MSRARLVITAVIVEGRTQAEVARTYGVSEGWVSKLLARYRREGDAAFEPRSRRPKGSPTATPRDVVEYIVELRVDLVNRGFDAGAKTIAWHLWQFRRLEVAPATINRILAREGLVIPHPKKRPRSSYVRFEADMPNECWQSDFTHYRLARRKGKEGLDVEILTFLDDHSRLILHMSAHVHVTGPIVVAAFREAVQTHGIPASTLTDNGMVFTTRFSGGKGALRLRGRAAAPGRRPEELAPQPPDDVREGRTRPTDAQEVAREEAASEHDRRAPEAARRIHGRVQLDASALEPPPGAHAAGGLPRATKGSARR
jgi:transposase